jgi:hypothetical protein
VPGADPVVELEPGEEIIMHVHAGFRGGAAASMRATFALGSARFRQKAHAEWLETVNASGFPGAPADMVVAITDRRMLIGKPGFWGGPPKAYKEEFPLALIAEAVTVRHGLITSAAFALTNGHIVEIESMRGRRLQRLVDLVNELRRPY